MMLKLIRNRAGLVLAGLIAALCPMLMAPTGGIPSILTLAQLTVREPIGTSAGQIHVASTATGATNVAYIRFEDAVGTSTGYVGDAGSGESDMYLADTVSGSNLQLTTVGTGLVKINTIDITPADSGSVTITFAAAQMPNCTGTGTNSTFSLHKVGKMVVGTTGATSGTCTTAGGTTNVATNNTPIPAAFRPASSTQCGPVVMTTSVNPGGQAGQICVTTAGNVQIFSVPATGSTSIGLVGLGSFSYVLD